MPSRVTASESSDEPEAGSPSSASCAVVAAACSPSALASRSSSASSAASSPATGAAASISARPRRSVSASAARSRSAWVSASSSLVHRAVPREHPPVVRQQRGQLGPAEPVQRVPLPAGLEQLLLIRLPVHGHQIVGQHLQQRHRDRTPAREGP